MGHSYGYRNHTRDLFSKPFRRHGMPSISRLLTIFKVGDWVDIKVDGAVHKGMPHKYYMGKTGRVFNVTPHAVGVEVNKKIRGKILKKRLHIRTEHVQQSRCRQDFLQRVLDNDAKRREAKAKGEFINLTRQPGQPRKAFTLKSKHHEIEDLAPVPYEIVL